MKQSPKREALSRERILHTALQIVDREGLSAISMRRIGEELGVEAMSLYNHVASKAAILDGIFETVLAELPPPRRSAAWQTVLRERARALRAVLRAHPNALPLFVSRPAVTPDSITHVESVLELLCQAGFPIERALMTLQTLVAYVVGHTLGAYRSADADLSYPAYDRLSAEEFPRVREMARLLPTHNLDKEFEYGLESMLTGIAARPLKSRGA